MMRYENQTFAGQTIQSDGHDYIRCDFTDTRLQYGGGALPKFEDCQFTRTVFDFTDAADRTIGFLRGLAGGGENGAHIVRTLLELDGAVMPGKYWTPHG